MGSEFFSLEKTKAAWAASKGPKTPCGLKMVTGQRSLSHFSSKRSSARALSPPYVLAVVIRHAVSVQGQGGGIR